MSFVRFADINRIYIVRDILDFHFNYCKLRCDKSFRSTEIKTVYKNNKTYVKTIKFKVQKKMFILIKRIYRIYKIPFKSYNELFRHFKNGYIGTTLSIISLETSPFETSFKLSSPDPIYRMLNIPLLTPLFAPVFEQEYIVIEDKPFERGSTMTISGYIYMKVKIRGSFNG